MSVGSDGRVSLFAWYVDKPHSVELRFMEDAQKIMLIQKSGLTKTKKKSFRAIAANTMYNVKVAYNGINFQVWIDGVLVPELTMTPVAIPAGKAVFRVKSTTGLPITGKFADIAVN